MFGHSSNDELAQHFADIGKRLDTAYAEGKFTEDEYNELNEGLNEYITHITEKNDFWRAQREVAKQNRSFSDSPQLSIKTEKTSASDADFLIKWRQEIEDYLDKNGRTKIEDMMDMINKYRYTNTIDFNKMLGK